MNTRMMFARVVAGMAMAVMFSSVACASEQSNDGGLAWTPLSISLFGCEKDAIGLPWNCDTTAGLDVSLLFVARKSVYGLQANFWAVTDEMYGGQVSALVNGAEEMRGVQVGLLNYVAEGSGLQVGAINQYNGTFGKMVQVGIYNGPFWRNSYGAGVQIGMFNDASFGPRLQIGLINSADHADCFQIGLLNCRGEIATPILGWSFK